MILQSDQAFHTVLENPESFGTVLVCGLMDEFGTDFLQWDPETVELEIKRVWRADPPRVNLDKIHAIVTCLLTNHFYRNLETFNQVCLVLNNVPANFDTFDIPGIAEVSWAIAEMSLLDRSDKSHHFEWDDEIKIMVKGLLERAGMYKAPKILQRVVTETLQDPTAIQDTFDNEASDSKAFFEDQQRQRMAVDQYVTSRMGQLLQAVVSLPLRHAQPGALEALRKNAQTIQEEQQKELSKTQDSLPHAPEL